MVDATFDGDVLVQELRIVLGRQQKCVPRAEDAGDARQVRDAQQSYLPRSGYANRTEVARTLRLPALLGQDGRNVQYVRPCRD